MVVTCMNPHSFVTALEDDAFRQALRESDMLLPDGVGVCMALKRWKGVEVPKIAGSDFHQQVLEELQRKGGSIFYMGSSPAVLQRSEQRLAKEYPNIRCRTYSPPDVPVLSEEDNARICQAIEEFAPDALMVGMTDPKQEKWIHSNLSRLHSPKVIGAVGGVFDFFAGTIKRAPAWAIRLHIEWLWRFVREPKRMWQRNMVSSPRFLRYTRKHHNEM